MYDNDAISSAFDFDFEFGRRAACSIEEKREICLPLILRLYDWAYTARREGLLSLEQRTFDLEDVMLKTAMNWVLAGRDPLYIGKALQAYISLSQAEGVELLRQFIAMQGILSMQQGENPLAIAEALALYLGDEMFEEALAAVGKAQEENDRPFDFPRQYLQEGFTDRSDQVSPHPLLYKHLIQQLPNIFYLCRSAAYTRKNIACYMRFLEEKPLFALLSRLPMRTTKEIVAQWGSEEQDVIIDAFAGAERHLGQALLFFAEQGKLYIERDDYAEIADFVAWNEQVCRNWSL